MKVLLVCFISPKIGVGHLSRLLALAQVIRKNDKLIPEFLIFGNFFKAKELSDFKIHQFLLEDNFKITIKNILETDNFDSIVFDLYPKHNIDNISELFAQLKQRNICLISVDSLIEHCNILDLIWVPSFNFDCSKYADCTSILKSGWGSFLIQKRLQNKDWSPGSQVLVLTGGSDASNLGKTLPIQLDELLPRGVNIHWVRGPFSSKPNLPKECRLNWTIHHAPPYLDELIVQSDYVLTVFGVAFFEVLQYGVPMVVFSPYGDKDNNELCALSKECVAMVVNSQELVANGLIDLMNNNELAKEYSMNSLKKISTNGAQNLAKEIYSLIASK